MTEPIWITDINAPELDVYARLTGAQLRSKKDRELGIFIAESPKVIKTALDAGYQPLSLLMEERHITGQGAQLIARCPDIPVYTAARETLEALTGYTLTRGILCAMARRTLPPVAEVCAGARRLAVLEGVVDATNIGAIFRSAAALHIDGVLLSPTCCDPLQRRAVRVSMGTVFQVPWTVLDSWPQGGMETLAAQGFRTAAMALDHRAVPMDDPSLRQIPKLAIVLGAEGDGLSKSTIARCDHTVMIPMAHGVDSLNVAAASAVAFWELRVR